MFIQQALPYSNDYEDQKYIQQALPYSNDYEAKKLTQQALPYPNDHADQKFTQQTLSYSNGHGGQNFIHQGPTSRAFRNPVTRRVLMSIQPLSRVPMHIHLAFYL